MDSTERDDASVPQQLLQSRSTKSNGLASVSDGFTAKEIQEALQPEHHEWHPQHEYQDCDIASLHPGPGAVMFMGRIANLFDVGHTPKTPRSAKGCIQLCIKDGTTTISVRFWYASVQPVFRLGSLVTIWTSYISCGLSNTISGSNATLFTSLFPERDRNCHLMLHENSDDCGMFKVPLLYQEGMPLDGLMTLQGFVAGGYDLKAARILVVIKTIKNKVQGKQELRIIKSEMPTSTVTRKDGTTTERVTVRVHDDTAEATLNLWGIAASSPQLPQTVAQFTSAACQDWKPGGTVLLIQSPGYSFGREAFLRCTPGTVIDIDPQIPDAQWLRRWSLQQKDREAINPPYPRDVFDIDATTRGTLRCLFTLAELDEMARALPKETFQGYLSLLIVETGLLQLWRRTMLMCHECCQSPLYANTLTATCGLCRREVRLAPNPRILGLLVDETGAIGEGKMILSDHAWHSLLGRHIEDLVTLDYDGIKRVSQRLMFCRLTVLFGWTGNENQAGGRICILDVTT